MLRFTIGRVFSALAVVVLALAFAVGPAACQEASEILEEAKQSHDEFMEEVEGLEMVTVMRMITRAGTLSTTTTTYIKGQKSRVESEMELNAAEGSAMEMGNARTIVLNDGVDTWLTSGFVPKKKLSTQEAGAYQTEHQWWQKFPDNAEIVGSAEYGGRDCHVVEITLYDNEPAVTAWLDKETLVMVGGEGGVQGRQLRWAHSDFREVEGREMPYRTDYYLGDDAVGTMTVESLELNAGLSDDLFDPKAL